MKLRDKGETVMKIKRERSTRRIRDWIPENHMPG